MVAAALANALLACKSRNPSAIRKLETLEVRHHIRRLMMKKLFQRLFAPVAAVLAFGSATAASARTTVARPALWEVSDPDTTIYLFGTIHRLPEDVQWRTPKLDQAV